LDDVSEKFRILHNKEPREMYRSSSVVRSVKYRRFRWGRHAARMGRRNAYIIWWDIPWEIKKEMVGCH